MQSVPDGALAKVTDEQYRGADPAYSDADRAKEFVSELHEFEQTGSYPQLVLVRLDGTKDFDQAIASLTDAVSRSRFGKETAVFSPSAARPSLSALRSIEIILGMHPMTIFDAAAPPLR